jgi:hypothetical protein
MSQIRNRERIHVMNRYLDEMTPSSVTIHDVDCIYHNHAKNFWCMFEWKNISEKKSKPNTLASLHEMNDAFQNACSTYRGLFFVQLGFSPDAFPFTDEQKVTVVWHYRGIIQEKTYPTFARSAVQYILDHGRLL